MEMFKTFGTITVQPHDPKPTFIRELDIEKFEFKDGSTIFRPTLWKTPQGIYLKVQKCIWTPTGRLVMTIAGIFNEEPPSHTSQKYCDYNPIGYGID